MWIARARATVVGVERFAVAVCIALPERSRAFFDIVRFRDAGSGLYACDDEGIGGSVEGLGLRV